MFTARARPILLLLVCGGLACGSGALIDGLPDAAVLRDQRVLLDQSSPEDQRVQDARSMLDGSPDGACAPASCAPSDCGEVSDGCGGIVNCGACDAGSCGPEGCTDAVRTMPCPSPETVDLVLSQPLTRFNRGLSGGAHSWSFHAAEFALAATAACGETRADDRFVEQIRHLLQPGNGTTSPGGYADQHQLGTLVAFAVATRLPRIWGRLGADERAKIGLMMRAGLVSNAFVTSDENPYVRGAGPQRAIDGNRDFSRDWNPNFRNGNLGTVIAMTVHFGVDAASELLRTHDHAAFIAELEEAGLDGLVETYRQPEAIAADEVNATLHEAYRYRGTALEEVFDLYATLTNFTFAGRVHCGLNDGAGVLAGGDAGGFVSNCDVLPNRGALGMLSEFDSIDGGGPRSSAGYANDGLRPNTYLTWLMLWIGPWEAVPGEALLERIRVGADDLFFKIDPARGGGYVDYHGGRVRRLVVYDDHHGHRVTEGLVRVLLSAER